MGNIVGAIIGLLILGTTAYVIYKRKGEKVVARVKDTTADLKAKASTLRGKVVGLKARALKAKETARELLG